MFPEQLSYPFGHGCSLTRLTKVHGSAFVCVRGRAWEGVGGGNVEESF